MKNHSIINIILLLLVFSISGCMKTNSVIMYTESEFVIVPTNISPTKILNCVGFYSGLFYYIRNDNLNYTVEFVDIYGEVKNEIAIPKGKGPGEISNLFIVKVNYNKIVLYDYSLSKICIYNVKGKHIKDIYLKEYTVMQDIAVGSEAVFLHEKINNKLIKIDYYNENMIKIEYKNQHNSVPKNGDKFTAGTIYYDNYNNNIIIGNFTTPYEMQVYSNDIKLKKIIIRDFGSKYDRAEWFSDQYGNSTCVGNIIISGIVSDEHYIYTSFGGGYVYTGNTDKLYKPLKCGIKISVFNKIDKSYCEITCNEFKDTMGFAKIVGVDRKFIYIFIYDSSKILNKYSINNEKYGYKKAFVVLRNPLYK